MLVVLLGAVSGAVALGDNSFFTHLTTGRLILDGHLPTTDHYSFTAAGQPWVIQSWFASLLYGLGDTVGHGLGIRLMVAVLSGVLAGLLWRLTRPAGSIVARLAAVAPALVIGFVSWGARPLIFGLLGFAVLLVVLLEERDPRWMVPVMWVWVNTHGSFPMAVVLIGAFGIGVLIDGDDLAHVVRTAKWTVLGILLGALNPLGPKLLWFPIELLSKSEALSSMIEWQAPSFTELWQRVFLVLLLVTVALIPRLGPERRYRLLIPALLFSALGFVAMRNLALASFTLLPVLATSLAGLGSLKSSVRKPAYTVATGALALVTIVLVAARLAGPSFAYASYPVAATDWLEQHGRLGPEHRLASQDYVGNYLELRSDGKVKVFVDDRVDMFPIQVVRDEATLLNAGPGWRKVLDRNKIDTVLWDQSKPLASVLDLSPAWKRVATFPRNDDSLTTWVVYERIQS